MAEERIQKILAKAGFGSRRDCEEYLRAGRITVNGIKVELGAKADPEVDKVFLDNKQVAVKTESIYIALHKPRKILSAINQDDDRKDVLDLVPFDGHLFPVGRLDYDSEGLLLLTNDGDFANKLAHPRYEHEKEYLVQVGSRPEEEQLVIWRRGVVLEDGYRTAAAKVEVIETQPKSAVLRIVLREGRKRQIRESGERIGIPVQRIKRIRIGTILLGNLKPGEWRNLTRQEIESMKNPDLTEDEVRPMQRATTGRGRATTHPSGKTVAVWRGRKTGATTDEAGSPARTPRKWKSSFTDNEDSKTSSGTRTRRSSDKVKGAAPSSGSRTRRTSPKLNNDTVASTGGTRTRRSAVKQNGEAMESSGPQNRSPRTRLNNESRPPVGTRNRKPSSSQKASGKPRKTGVKRTFGNKRG